MPRPPFLVDTTTLPETDTPYPDSDERLAFGRRIGEAAGLQRIGLHLERVPPGRRTSYPHAESDEEEFVLVLEGEIDAWIDGTLHRMRAGDLAGFPAGTGICHAFLNNGDRDALLLVGGERTKPTNRLYYPRNPERRARMQPGQWWDDIPRRPQGDHDGRAGCRVGAAARAWAESLVIDGAPVDLRTLDAWAFGDSPELADELADLVVHGDKRATAGLVWTYEHERFPLLRAGDRVVITRFDGAPRCLIEITEAFVRPFDQVDEAFAADEGEGERTLASWRRDHWAYFARECAALGREPATDMPVLCARFRVLTTAPGS